MQLQECKSEAARVQQLHDFASNSRFTFTLTDMLCEKIFLLCAQAQLNQNTTVELYDSSQYYFIGFMKF